MFRISTVVVLLLACAGPASAQRGVCRWGAQAQVSMQMVWQRQQQQQQQRRMQMVRQQQMNMQRRQVAMPRVAQPRARVNINIQRNRVAIARPAAKLQRITRATTRQQRAIQRVPINNGRIARPIVRQQMQRITLLRTITRQTRSMARVTRSTTRVVRNTTREMRPITRTVRSTARVARDTTRVARDTTRVTRNTDRHTPMVQLRITMGGRCGSCHGCGQGKPAIISTKPPPVLTRLPRPAIPGIVRSDPVRRPGIVAKPRIPVPAIVRKPRPAMPRLAPPPALAQRLAGRRPALLALPSLPSLYRLATRPISKPPGKGSSMLKIREPVRSPAPVPALDRAPPPLPALDGPILSLTRHTPLSDSAEESVPVGPLLPSVLARGPELAALPSGGLVGPGLLPNLGREEADVPTAPSSIELASRAPALPPLP